MRITLFILLLALQACSGPSGDSNEDKIKHEKAPQLISFKDGNSITKEFIDENFVNLASAPGSGTVSYQIDNENVATIDETTGEIDILAMGNAVITATISEDANYLAAAGSFQLTVERASPTIQFSGVPDEGFHLVANGKSFTLPFPKLYLKSDFDSVNFYEEFNMAPSDAYTINISNNDSLTLNFDLVEYYPYEIFVKPLNIGTSEVTFTSPASERLKSVTKSFIVKLREGDDTFEFNSDENIVVTLDTPAFTRIASGGHGQLVSYTSSRPDIATVDEITGTVNIKGVGTAIISAVNQGQGAVDSDFANYTIFVKGETPPSPKVLAWIGQSDTTLKIINSDNDFNFSMTSKSTCEPIPPLACDDLTQGTLTNIETLNNQISLSSASTVWFEHLEHHSLPIDISAERFAPGFCRQKLVFKNRLWLIAGRIDDSLNSGSPEDGYNTSEVWSSVDGYHWKNETKQANFPPMNCYRYKSFIHNEMMWLISTNEEGNIYVWYSQDGKSWQSHLTNISLPSNIDLSSHIVTFENRVFLYHRQNYCADSPCLTSVWSSQDGKHWTEIADIANLNLQPVVFNDTLFNFAHGYAWTSKNGIDWQKQQKSAAGDNVIVHENKLWSRSSSGGFDGMFPHSNYKSSKDGYNWRHEKSENSHNFSGFAKLISFKGYLWLIEPYGEDPFSLTTNTVLKSNDGRTWENASLGQLECASTRYDDTADRCRYTVFQGKFWQGINNKLHSSEDGVNWIIEESAIPTTNLRTLIVFHEKLWLFDQGKSWSSSDGLQWQLMSQGQSFATPNYESVFPFVQEGQLLLITKKNGENTAYWLTNDGISWQYYSINESSPINKLLLVHDKKYWSSNKSVVSFSENLKTWQDVESLPSNDFRLVSFQNNLLALITIDGKRKFLRLNEQNEWISYTNSTPLSYNPYHPAFFRVKNDELYFFSYGDNLSITPVNIWKSDDAEHWRKGIQIPILFN